MTIPAPRMKLNSLTCGALLFLLDYWLLEVLGGHFQKAGSRLQVPSTSFLVLTIGKTSPMSSL